MAGAEPEITEDSLLGGRVALRQPRNGYRVAIDPVLLAASVRAKPGQSVLDVGCGTGAVFLCLAARIAGLDITGLDKAAGALALAQDNAASNGVAAVFIEGDILDPPMAFIRRDFHHVISNPPFWPSDRTRPSPDAGRQASNAMEAGALAAWIRACAGRLRNRGTLSLILPADALEDAVAALSGVLGSLSVLPLWPRSGQPAKRVILQAVKGGRGPSVLHCGLVLHGEGSRYTDQAQRVLTDGASLWDVG